MGELLILNFNKKGRALGVMFVLIAVLLIAVISTDLLLNIGGKLEQESYDKLRQAQAHATSGFAVMSVTAQDGESGSLNQFFVTVRAAPGSGPLPLDDLLVVVRLPNSSTTLRYAGSTLTSIDDANQTHYVVEHIHRSDVHIEGKLQNAEMAIIKFLTPHNVSGGTILTVLFVPKTGSATEKQVYIPEIINKKQMQLYPQV